jgi:hypothetical protein
MSVMSPVERVAGRGDTDKALFPLARPRPACQRCDRDVPRSLQRPRAEGSLHFSRIPTQKSQNPAISATGHKNGADDAGAGSTTAQTPTPTSGGASGGGKSVDIYVVLLPGATRDGFADVASANTIWSQCSLKVNLAGGESWATSVMDTLPPTGVLNEYPAPTSPTSEELSLLDHHPGGKGMIHAYFVPALSAGSRGESFWASVTPNGVRAVIVSDSAASDTFAHELGHVLLNDGNHHSDPDNLMAPGSSRNVGVDKLDATQCSKV